MGQINFAVDGHAHAAGEFFPAPSIVQNLDDLGIDKVILCPGPVSDPAKYPLPNLSRILGKRRLEFAGSPLLRQAAKRVLKKIDLMEVNADVAAMARRYPDRIVQACWVDPTENDLTARLGARLSAWGYRALKVHQCFHRIASDGPEMRDLARFAADRGLPLFIHLYSRKDAVALVGLISAHPDTTFIVAHLLGLDVFIEADRSILKNVYFDTSPPSFLPLWSVKKAITHFGPEKALLGSDTPYGKNNLRTAVARIRGLDLPEADKALILGGNARRIYGL